MVGRSRIAAALLACGFLAQPISALAERPPDPGTHPAADTVHVAPSTGDRETDRSNVLAALEEVQPGGTILFAQGTYLIGGEIIRVTVPRITLLGHPEGTTLRGCDPGEFPWEDLTEFGNNCNAIELAAGHQTVRNLTFEHAMWALHVGCCWSDRPGFEAGGGGHLIEGNTFRNSSNGVRVHGFWIEPTVIRNNRFLNDWHSVAIYGNTVHLLDNDISAPEPEKVQLLGFPGDAVHIGPPATLHESVQGVTRTCENNVVAGNRIDGTTEGIMVMADDETPCRNNVIRDNTIAIRRARPAAIPGFIRVHDDTDETVVGVPLALRGAVVDNLIEGNVINGAEGLGIEIRHASRNRIMSNTVTRVSRREPFPGNAIAALPIVGGDPNAWRDANGSAIWVSPGSDGNEIVGNAFEDVEAAAVFLEGDDNRVELRSASDSVRDLGTGNEVTATDSAGASARSYWRPLASPNYTFPSCDLPMEGPHGTSDLVSRYVTMRDGVGIAVDIVLPDPLPQGEPVPTVLIMTRYWRGEEGQGPDRRARVFTSHGYALVVGDVRGTGASFGEWPHHRSEDETRDFVEIIDWIVEQPWSDGQVSGFGISYSANTADWMAARGHPALEAVVSRFPDFDPFADLYFPGGVPNAYMGREWGNRVKEMDLNVKRPYEDGPRGVRPVDADSAGRVLAEAIADRREVPSVWEGLREVTYREDQPESWHGASVDDWGTHTRTETIERWGGPIQSWASWRDAGTANGVLHRFMTLDNAQRAFIGAWNHGGDHDADPYRPDSARARLPFTTQVLEDLCFLRRRSSGGSDPGPDRKLVYYTMGEGRWKAATEWPPAGSELEPWYLSGEGRLARAVPATAADEYEVDFTASTGTTNRWATNNTGGDVRYGDRAEEDRKLLTYTSDPLPRDLEITGQPVATLHVASTHEDGAFFVYLEEVAPDGTVRYLTEGMLRALHRNVADEAPPYEMMGPYHTFERKDGELLVPGQVTTLELELMPLSVRVPEGHRLRIAIAGSDADTFRRIPESGTPTMSVHYGGERPSRVSLPVMRR